VAIDQLKEQMEDEQVTQSDIQRQLVKANSEAAALRSKAEAAESAVRPEELEDVKRKMGSRIQDSETQLEVALSKAITMEKAKNRLQAELEGLAEEFEKVSCIDYI